MSYQNPRIDLNDSFQQAVIKMVDGNPGAIGALMAMCMASPEVDPDAALGPYTPMLSLDVMDVYGSDIYVYFKEVCNRDVVTALGLLRAQQLGFIDERTIKQMITEGQNYKQPDPAVIGGYIAQVREQLPNFKR